MLLKTNKKATKKSESMSLWHLGSKELSNSVAVAARPPRAGDTSQHWKRGWNFWGKSCKSEHCRNETQNKQDPHPDHWLPENGTARTPQRTQQTCCRDGEGSFVKSELHRCARVFAALLSQGVPQTRSSRGRKRTPPGLAMSEHRASDCRAAGSWGDSQEQGNFAEAEHPSLDIISGQISDRLLNYQGTG